MKTGYKYDDGKDIHVGDAIQGFIKSPPDVDIPWCVNGVVKEMPKIHYVEVPKQKHFPAGIIILSQFDLIRTPKNYMPDFE